MPRKSKMKVFVGHHFVAGRGQVRVALAATSQKRAAEILECGVVNIRDYFISFTEEFSSHSEVKLALAHPETLFAETKRDSDVYTEVPRKREPKPIESRPSIKGRMRIRSKEPVKSEAVGKARTKANICDTAQSIGQDIELLQERLEMHKTHNLPVKPEEQERINDVMGTLAVNMRVFADALDEERKGATDFVGGMKPSELLDKLTRG